MHWMTPPCVLVDALELLSESTTPGAGCDDMFRAFSNLGQVQRHVAHALHAANLLDQMVGTPVEHRPPWSHYRSRIGKKFATDSQEPLNDCCTHRFAGSPDSNPARGEVDR